MWICVFDFLLPLSVPVEHLFARHRECRLWGDCAILNGSSNTEHFGHRTRLVGFYCRDVSRSVGIRTVVIATHVGHRIDLARLGVHHDCGAAARQDALHLLLQNAIDLKLQRAMNGGHQVDTTYRWHIVAACRSNALATAVHFAFELAVHTRQHVVVLLF